MRHETVVIEIERKRMGSGILPENIQFIDFFHHSGSSYHFHPRARPSVGCCWQFCTETQSVAKTIRATKPFALKGAWVERGGRASPTRSATSVKLNIFDFSGLVSVKTKGINFRLNIGGPRKQ
jgi:hypothetical protein